MLCVCWSDWASLLIRTKSAPAVHCLLILHCLHEACLKLAAVLTLQMFNHHFPTIWNHAVNTVWYSWSKSVCQFCKRFRDNILLLSRFTLRCFGRTSFQSETTPLKHFTLHSVVTLVLTHGWILKLCVNSGLFSPGQDGWPYIPTPTNYCVENGLHPAAIFSTVCKYKFVIWSHMVELQNEYKIGAVYI